MASHIPEGTYLKDLFTREFIAWVSERIKNDFTPDIVAELQHQYNINSDERLAWARQETQYVIAARDAAQKITDSYNELHRQIDQLTTVNKSLEAYPKMYQEKHEQLCDVIRESNDRMDLINEQQRKIDQLKIRLYDLEHAS